MILDLGLIDYLEALKLQRELVNKRRLNEIPDSVMIAEHPCVFTIGRAGSRKNLLIDELSLSNWGIKVIDVDRGGNITNHSPGQLVIYPVLDLKKRTKDLHRYLRDLEEVAINFLKKYDAEGVRINNATGVWVDGKKIASIGIAVRDWVTYHGLSVNINNDISFFSMINTCGIKGLKVTSLKEILRQEVAVNSAKCVLVNEFNKIFGTDNVQAQRELYSTVA